MKAIRYTITIVFSTMDGYLSKIKLFANLTPENSYKMWVLALEPHLLHWHQRITFSTVLYKILKYFISKMTKGTLSLSLYTVVVYLIVASSALDLNSSKEQPCFNISKTVPLDLNWVGSIKTLYYPLMSRFELYRIAGDLLGGDDVNELPEDRLYYDSCIYWNMYTNGTIISRGFSGLNREYKTKLLSPSMEKFEFFPKEGKGFSGTVYTTMTDNKTFLFTPFCTSDGEMAWGLGSTLPSLPKETLESVKMHAKELGFKKDYFTGLQYNNCNLGKSDSVDSGEDQTTTPTNFIDITEMP